MAAARLFPDGVGQGKRGKKDEATSELSSEVSARYLRQARTVLREAKALADGAALGPASTDHDRTAGSRSLASEVAAIPKNDRHRFRPLLPPTPRLHENLSAADS